MNNNPTKTDLIRQARLMQPLDELKRSWDWHPGSPFYHEEPDICGECQFCGNNGCTHPDGDIRDDACNQYEQRAGE